MGERLRWRVTMGEPRYCNDIAWRRPSKHPRTSVFVPSRLREQRVARQSRSQSSRVRRQSSGFQFVAIHARFHQTNARCTRPVVSPANAAPMRNYYPTLVPPLTWTGLSWATGYQIEISKSPTFAGTPIYKTPDNNPIPPNQLFWLIDPPIMEDGVYYWRVRGRKADGTWSTTWSSVESFVVDLP